MKYTGIAAVCLLLLALLPASCIKDDYAAKEKATVTMTFTTRAISGNSATTADVLELNERMHTLRVIVARKSGEILYNLKYEIGEEETSKTITFSELTVNADGEAFDFYAIANEEGVGYSGNWDYVAITDLKDMNLQGGFLTDANDASKNIKIPQTAYKQITVTPQADGGIRENMKLDFAVAKVRLTINNTSSGVQNVTGISLSGVNMTSTPLFVGESLSTENQGMLSLGDMTIPANESATVYAYFYENTGGNYTLAANWNAESKTLSFGRGTKYDISSISRGTELDINITLNATTTPTFNIEVVPWEEVNVDVPPFQ